MTFGNLVGLIGVGITLIAYSLLNINKISSRSFAFPSLNAFGSVLIIYSLYCDWNLPAFVMEGSWLAVSIYGIYQAWRRQHI